MDLTETAEQAALREAVRDFLDRYAADPRTYDPAIWRRLTGELGLVGLAVPERLGGAGATLAEVMLVAEESGRVLLPAPYLSSAVAATLLAELADADGVLPDLVAGSTVAALALDADVTSRGSGAGVRLSGRARHVLDGPSADVLVVRSVTALYLVAAADVSVVPVGTLDQTRSQATVELAGAPATPLSPAGDGGAAARRAENLMRLALAAESVGAARRCLSMTVQHLKTRVQFGRPIGSFQALRHRCADLAVLVEAATSTVRAATWTARFDPDGFAVDGPLAKLYCADTFLRVAAETIQLHGGIGFTWEHEAHLYLKRAKSTQLLYGSPGELRALIGRRAGILSTVDS